MITLSMAGVIITAFRSMCKLTATLLQGTLRSVLLQQHIVSGKPEDVHSLKQALFPGKRCFCTDYESVRRQFFFFSFCKRLLATLIRVHSVCRSKVYTFVYSMISNTKSVFVERTLVVMLTNEFHIPMFRTFISFFFP